MPNGNFKSRAPKRSSGACGQPARQRKQWRGLAIGQSSPEI